MSLSVKQIDVIAEDSLLFALSGYTSENERFFSIEENPPKQRT